MLLRSLRAELEREVPGRGEHFQVLPPDLPELLVTESVAPSRGEANFVLLVPGPPHEKLFFLWGLTSTECWLSDIIILYELIPYCTDTVYYRYCTGTPFRGVPDCTVQILYRYQLYCTIPYCTTVLRTSYSVPSRPRVYNTRTAVFSTENRFTAPMM